MQACPSLHRRPRPASNSLPSQGPSLAHRAGRSGSFVSGKADEVGCGGRSDLVRMHWHHKPDGGSDKTGSGELPVDGWGNPDDASVCSRYLARCLFMQVCQTVAVLCERRWHPDRIVDGQARRTSGTAGYDRAPRRGVTAPVTVRAQVCPDDQSAVRAADVDTFS